MMQRTREPWVRCLCLALVLPFLLWGNSSADILVFRNGDRLQGTVVDRDAWRLNPYGQGPLSFMPSDAAENATPQVFEIAAIAYVVLEDGTTTTILDPHVAFPHAASPGSGASANKPQKTVRNYRVQGAVFMGAGIALAVVGLTYGFGESELSGSEPEREKDVVNFALVIAGTALFIAGVVTMAQAEERGQPTTAPSMGIQASPSGASLFKHWRF